MIKGKFVLGMVILSMVALLLGACAGPATSNKGTMQVYVTDAPPKGVTAIEIKASNVEAHMSGATEDHWISLLKEPPVFDLVKAIGVNVLLGTSNVAAGKYTQVRLDITDVTVTLNGKQVKATVPSDKLKLVGEITVEEGKKTLISLDFDAEKSIVLAGQDKVSFKPVVRLVVAKPGEALETPIGISGLNMKTPDQARASETVVIKIIDDAGKPISGVRIYSPEYLGDTAKDGSLVTFFKEPGDYEIVARKGKTGEPGFTEAQGMISIIPSHIELQAFDGILPLLPPGQTYTGDQNYKPAMTVRFSFKNTSDTEILLNNSAPWKIQSREGETVFEPIALQAIVQLAPGEHKEWTWNQKDNDDRQVSEDGYMVVLKCSEGEYSLRFWIIPEGMTP